jgi:hypothetical protein
MLRRRRGPIQGAGARSVACKPLDQSLRGNRARERLPSELRVGSGRNQVIADRYCRYETRGTWCRGPERIGADADRYGADQPRAVPSQEDRQSRLTGGPGAWRVRRPTVLGLRIDEPACRGGSTGRAQRRAPYEPKARTIGNRAAKAPILGQESRRRRALGGTCPGLPTGDQKKQREQEVESSSQESHVVSIRRIPAARTMIRGEMPASDRDASSGPKERRPPRRRTRPRAPI